MTTAPNDLRTVTDAVPPPPRPEVPLPPKADRGRVLPSVRARSSPITHLRYVALASPTYDATVAFYRDVWGLYPVVHTRDIAFLGAVGSPARRGRLRRPVGHRRPGKDLFALSHSAPADAGLWVPAPV